MKLIDFIKKWIWPVPAPASGNWKDEMLVAHNKVRAAHGLSPLRTNSKLDASAQEGIDACARHGYLDHGNPWTRMKAHGYNYTTASENMAKGQMTATQVVDDWMKADPGHRANVLGKWIDVGFGHAGQIYWAADYGSPQ